MIRTSAVVIRHTWAGWHASHIGITARRKGDGGVLNGTKFLIGNEVGADLCVVAAKSDPDAVQAHGGWDVVDRPKVERLFRDSRHTRIREGTSEIQRLVISRGVLEPAVK